MKTRAGGKKRSRPTASAAMLCALVASLALAAAPAGAETGDVAEIRDLDDGGFILPAISGPEAPQEYPFRVHLSSEQRLEQTTPTEVLVRYPEGLTASRFEAEPAHDADGSNVPTTLTVSGPDIVTWTIHFRAGNPAAAGAPFAFPITAGPGWEGGFSTVTVIMPSPIPSAAGPTPAATCTVPSLHGVGLRAAKARLRAHHCAIGKVHLARGATKGKGKVVKQFRDVGDELTAGTPVAIKLGAR